MAIYLKKFETMSQYNAYTADTENFILPNVSLTVDNNTVHYNPYVLETRVVAKYNVTSTSNPTKIGYNQYTSGFSAIEIDGTEQPSVVSAYTFSTTGEHTVKYTLADQTSIGQYAFYRCSGLTSIAIPNSVTSIGMYAFTDCSGLTSINIPSGVTSIGVNTFYRCSALTSIVIPNSVTSIGSGTFFNCSGLTSINIPSGVTSIGDGTFQQCTSLTGVVIPDSVTSIGMYAFNNCSGLTSCTIGSGVTSIGDGAFNNCSGLTSVTIPSSVTSIGDMAFKLVQYLTCNGVTYTANADSTYNGYKGYWITLGNGQQAFVSVEVVPPCCFVAGTKITMYDLSTKNIENVQVGDRVLSYDIENDENIITTVKRTITHENTTNIAAITLENGYTITMNEYHPILCDNGWHSITNYEGFTTLSVGDMVKVQDGYSKLVSIERSAVEPFITYNLDVISDEEINRADDEANDNYYANGICAHNPIC